MTAVVNGRHELKSLTIDPEAVDPEDVEMLQDMIVAAVNEAMRSADADAASTMQSITGGLGLGGSGESGAHASPPNYSISQAGRGIFQTLCLGGIPPPPRFSLGRPQSGEAAVRIWKSATGIGPVFPRVAHASASPDMDRRAAPETWSPRSTTWRTPTLSPS